MVLENASSSNALSSKVAKFIAVGIWNTALGIITISLMHNLFSGIHELVILAMSSTIVILQSHFIMRKFVWKSSNSYLKELITFSAGYLPVFAANVAVIYLFVTVLNYDLITTQVIFAFVSAAALFLYQNFYTFRKRNESQL